MRSYIVGRLGIWLRILSVGVKLGRSWIEVIGRRYGPNVDCGTWAILLGCKRPNRNELLVKKTIVTSKILRYMIKEPHAKAMIKSCPTNRK